MIPPLGEIALVEGARYLGTWDREWTTSIVSLGSVSFPSGRIIVGDALCTEFATHPAFERLAPTGEAEAFLSIAHSKTEAGEDDQRRQRPGELLRGFQGGSGDHFGDDRQCQVQISHQVSPRLIERTTG